MFIKEFRRPLHLVKYESLKRRIHPAHPAREFITNDYKSFLSGYRGEKSLLFYLYQIESIDSYLFHNLRLPHRDFHFQIDFLLLTPFYALIIEVKHLLGDIYLDYPIFQMVRTHEGKMESFPDPVHQSHSQKQFLSHWLPHAFPIECVVVMTQPQSVIRLAPDYPFPNEIIHPSQLISHITSYQELYKTAFITKDELHHLNNKLLIGKIEQNPCLLSKYKLSSADIQSGVHCPFCEKLSMSRLKGYWVCPHCQKRDQHAHLQSLLDYSLLLSSTINNQEFRRFTKTDSIYMASKVLSATGLPKVGKNKGRKYQLTDQKGLPLFY